VPVLEGPDAHLLTRPMRLGESLADALDGGVPRPRRPRQDVRLSEV
jgi:hypothetical protein